MVDNHLSYRTRIALNLVSFNEEMVRLGSNDVKKESILKQYPKVFSGKIGKLKDYQVHIEVDEQIKPTQQPHYPIPIHYIEPTNEKLDLLIKK